MMCIQSGASSLAKHGVAYFWAIRGSIKDPGPHELQVCLKLVGSAKPVTFV